MHPTLFTASVLWFGVSVQQLCFGLDSHYSDVAVGWTRTTSTEFGLDSHYIKIAVVGTISTATVVLVGKSLRQLCCGLDSHYINVAMVWTISTATVLWVAHSVQRICCG